MCESKIVNNNKKKRNKYFIYNTKCLKVKCILIMYDLLIYKFKFSTLIKFN